MRGCAMEVVARLGGGPSTRILCLYLADGQQTEIAIRVRSLLVADDTPTFAGGDLNLQLLAPRDGEAPCAAEVTHLLREVGALPVAYSGTSHKDKRGSSLAD